MIPTFLSRLTDPSIQTILLCGCGGGFDFVHGLVLHPELSRLGKRFVIASYSFGNPDKLEGDAEIVFDEAGAVVKRVTAQTTHPDAYAPEVHVCSYLDTCHPDQAPHYVYASNARTFAVPTLTRLYEQLIARHKADAVVLIDGGSDALMVGDECGLGDPIEDAVSVQAVAALEGVSCKLLIQAGLGVDRHNGVSDASSLRAVAELNALGGFLGALAIEPGSPSHLFYRDAIAHIYARQDFRSVVTAAILGAIEGHFGAASVPTIAGRPVGPDTLSVWPPMSFLWGFDVETVARRSKLGAWLRNAQTPAACYAALKAGRQALEEGALAQEQLPRASDWPWAGYFDAPQ